ncbi:hypothetical protein [Paenibacillus oleatilyticus]|uniref:hypothetical protein n=1 Tax=Paenibacillus oleatilyticus TaxID=2594886 RepID=UPI001C1F82B0|nr:hypothetical protein [Paenibacillus oleatilyticus]MBU7319156.1 hypothetical protein [Paenibacillus oleatilyticus]
MNELLIEKIDKIMEILSEDYPQSLTYGEIVKDIAGEQFTKIDNSILEDYYFITNRYERLIGGVINVFSQRKVDKIQFYVEEMLQYDGEWICIGKIERYPLFINKVDGHVTCLFGEPLDQDYVLESYGDFNNFLLNYFLGEQYGEIGLKFVESGGSIDTVGSKDDEWYKVLEENHLL